MNSIVQARLAEVAALCGRYSVRRLALFGSATRPDFDPERSDLDFLVDFEHLAPQAHADAYFGLLAALEALFERPIDLVESAALRNPYRRQEIEATELVVHAAA
ncbi:MAG TPA: nucleotidyltransferase domain-containing protein [Patescibacteria group bacterium]|nr:nucleotidyltransferase domain-containing protein [Patescibacteria group bacterium]